MIWGGFSVSNATLNRFFSLHYLLPFLLAALAVAHLIALHEHGSNNPNGVTSSGDRYAMHPYFVFKDLVTIFAFFLVLSIMVFFYPNVLGQLWPMIIFLIVNIINTCAISWKYILKFYLVKIYNRTIFISDLIFNVNKIRDFVSLVFSFKLNPNIVRYYYRVYNQQITKVIKFFTLFTVNLFLVLVIMRSFIYLNLLNYELYLNKFSLI